MTEKPLSDDVLARLDRLESQARITELVHRYAQNIRLKQFDDCHALFTEDATFEVRQAPPADPAAAQTTSKSVGVEAIIKYIGHGGGAGVCPMIHNIVIDIAGNEARAMSVMAATIWATGQVLVGEYRDSFRRDREWRFTSRVYTMFR